MKKITMAEMRKITKSEMKNYITNVEQARIWARITSESKIKVGNTDKTRRNNFDGARKAYFEEIGMLDHSAPVRDFELEAQEILAMFEAQEAASKQD